MNLSESLWSVSRWRVGRQQRWVPGPSFHDGGASAGAGGWDHAAEVLPGWCSAQDPPPRSALTVTETAAHCRWGILNMPHGTLDGRTLPSVFTLDNYIQRQSCTQHCTFDFCFLVLLFSWPCMYSVWLCKWSPIRSWMLWQALDSMNWMVHQMFSSKSFDQWDTGIVELSCK